MRLRGKIIISSALLLFVIVSGAKIAPAQRGQQPEPLGFLKRVLTEASAPELTSEQELQLNTLVTNFRNAMPKDPNEALGAARAAYNGAIIAGDLATAQAQATIISDYHAAQISARVQATAKFQIDVMTVLKSGGQLDVLRQKLGDERLVGLVGSLVEGPPFGGRRPGFGPGGSPRFSPGERQGGIGRK